MKNKHLYICIALFISAISFSQSGINYKALIKDSNGNVVANQSVDVQFSILQGVAQTNVYREMHTPTTDANGIIIINIGEGTTSDVFTDIEWSSDDHFLNVEIDIGSGYVDFGTTQFMQVPYAIQAENAANVKGLEAIDEGNGIGWRLVGKNPDFFGDIGLNATDLSWSVADSQPYGATGSASLASGAGTIASGNYSVALGLTTEASANSSTAIGNSTEASGGVSFAGGFNTISSGFNAFGYGNESSAVGNYATVFGRYTQADSRSVTVLGRYNVGGGSNSNWNSFDPLFEIGNGSSPSNRNNALTVLKSGLHRINSSTSGLTIEANVYGLYIPNAGVDAIFIESPSGDGIDIANTGDNGIEIVAPGGNGIVISGANDDGIVISADDEGARITGNNVGVYANGGPFSSDVPDIILGSSTNTVFSDDGIISTNPERLGSDMFLRSYDAVVIQLDYDNNENGNFRIRNSDQNVVFDITEIGNVNIEGRLQIGDETIEDIGTDVLEFDAHLVPSSDTEFLLGFSSRRWNAVYATNGVINTSDRRSKTNIASLNYGLKDILKLNPVSFNWKTNPNDDAKLGLIAQDLLKVIPEVVKTHDWETDEDGNKIKIEFERMGVYYSDLVPVLIKAIQEQQNTIDTLKSTIQNNNRTIKNQEQLSLEHSKVLEALLSRVEALEQSNN